VGGRVGAVPQEHTSSRHEPGQLGRIVRLRLLGDGDARRSTATRRLRRLATCRYPDRMDRRRLIPPGFIEPCIPTLAHKPPSGPGWVHEIKHDGYRLIVRRDGTAVRLFTRRGHDWTDRYPAIAAAAARLKARSFTPAGEAVVADGVAVFDTFHRSGRARVAKACEPMMGGR
jgi:ATP-dependent DNA ligase